MIPDCIKNIIIKYERQLMMNDVHIELENNHFDCHQCYNDKYKHIKKNYNICECCREPICNDCVIKNKKNNYCKGICSICFFNNMIMSSIESIIERNLTDNEYDRLYEILDEYLKEDLEDLLRHMFFLQHYERDLDFEEIFEEVLNFIDI